MLCSECQRNLNPETAQSNPRSYVVTRDGVRTTYSKTLCDDCDRSEKQKSVSQGNQIKELDSGVKGQ
jgi:hypothetical protein